MDELQTLWEIPCTGQFVSLFRDAFNLPEMDIEELEEGIIADGTPGGSEFLNGLLVALLRGCYPRRGVSLTNFGEFLFKILEKKWVKEQGQVHPIAKDSTFSQLPIRTKAVIIYNLCLYRLDSDDVAEAMKNMEPNTLRVQSLGTDNKENVYWYFFGTRLYKEEPSPDAKKKDWKEEWKQEKKNAQPKKRKRGRPKKINKSVNIKSDGESEESEESETHKNGFMNLDSKSRWSVVCTTINEWQDFAEKFKNSKIKCEIALYKIIKDNFLPVLGEIYEEKEKRIQKKMMEFAPRRASSRLETKKKQKGEHHYGDDFEVYGDNDEFPEELPQPTLIKDRAQRLEERQRNLEEKMLNAQVREAKNETFAAAIEPVMMPPDTDNDKQLLDIRINNSPDVLCVKLRQVITVVKLHKDAWPFIHPVEEAHAPGYYEIVKDPIDISIIERKIHCRVYKSVTQIDQDFQKMVNNCEMYNGPKSAYTNMVNTLWRTFRKAVAKFVMQNPATYNNTPPKVARIECVENVASSPTVNTEKVVSQMPNLIENKMKKRKRQSGMKALDILAQASEIALKNVKKTEDEIFVPKKQGLPPPKSRVFPGLKIVTIQSHPASFISKFAGNSNSSQGESDASQHGNSSPASATHIGNSLQSIEPKKYPFAKGTNTSKFIHTSYVTDSSFSNKSHAGKTRISEVSSRELSTVPSEPSDCTVNSGIETCIPDAPNTLPSIESFAKDSSNETQRFSSGDYQLPGFLPTDASGNDSLCKISSLFSRIIKDSDFQMPDSQSTPNEENGDVNNLMNPSQSPVNVPSMQSNSPERNPVQSQTIFSAQSPVSNQGMSLMHPNIDLTLLHANRNISTVDASILGIQTGNHYYEGNETDLSHLNNCSPSSKHQTFSVSDHLTKAETRCVSHDTQSATAAREGAELVHMTNRMHELDKRHSPLYDNSMYSNLFPHGSSPNYTAGTSQLPLPLDKDTSKSSESHMVHLQYLGSNSSTMQRTSPTTISTMAATASIANSGIDTFNMQHTSSSSISPMVTLPANVSPDTYNLQYTSPSSMPPTALSSSNVPPQLGPNNLSLTSPSSISSVTVGHEFDNQKRYSPVYASSIYSGQFPHASLQNYVAGTLQQPLAQDKDATKSKLESHVVHLPLGLNSSTMQRTSPTSISPMATLPSNISSELGLYNLQHASPSSISPTGVSSPTSISPMTTLPSNVSSGLYNLQHTSPSSISPSAVSSSNVSSHPGTNNLQQTSPCTISPATSLSGNASPELGTESLLSVSQSIQSPNTNAANMSQTGFFMQKQTEHLPSAASLSNQIPLQLPFTGRQMVLDSNVKAPTYLPSGLPYLLNHQQLMKSGQLQPMPTLISGQRAFGHQPSQQFSGDSVPYVVNVSTASASGIQQQPSLTSHAVLNSSGSTSSKSSLQDIRNMLPNKGENVQNGSAKKCSIPRPRKKKQLPPPQVQNQQVSYVPTNNYHQIQPVVGSNQSASSFVNSDNYISVNTPVSAYSSITNNMHSIPIQSNAKNKPNNLDFSFIPPNGQSSDNLNSDTRHSVIIAAPPLTKAPQMSTAPILPSYVLSGANANLRLCLPGLSYYAGKDNTTLFSHSMPPVLSAQPSNRTLSSSTHEGSNNTVIDHRLLTVSQVHGTNTSSASDPTFESYLRDSRVNVSAPTKNDEQYTVVNTLKKSITSHTLSPNKAYSGTTLLHPTHNQLQDSREQNTVMNQNLGRSNAQQSSLKQPSKAMSAYHMTQLPRTIDGVLQSSVLEGMQPRPVDVTSHQLPYPTYINIPSFMIPPQSGLHHSMVPSHLLPVNQRFTTVQPTMHRLNDYDRQPVAPNKATRFYAGVPGPPTTQ